MASNQSGGWWRKFSSTSPTDGFADLNWMTRSQITPHSARPEHENGNRAAFYEIVKQCIDSGLIDGEAMAADGSYIPANVSRESWINVETEVEQSTRSRAMPVCAVQNGRAVLTRLEFGAECWPAAVIRHFSEGISAWELLNSCP